jgi:hypothetical protein
MVRSRARDTRAIEKLLATAPITFNELIKKRDVRSGYVHDELGRIVHVVLRARTGVGALYELRAYKLHEFSPFTNEFPVTVQRNDGLIQERLGKCLLDRMKFVWNKCREGERFPGRRAHRLPSLEQLFEENAIVRDQLEQTCVERWILAERDGKLDNVLVTCRDGEFRFANVDMEGAFCYDKPYTAYHLTVEWLAGARISQSTVDKVATFKAHLGSREGQILLDQLEMNDTERLGMNSRMEQIITEEHFPAQ